MLREESEVRQLLSQVGAKFIRKSSNSHEVWQVGDKRFICNAKGRNTKGKAWRNDLANLKRLVGYEALPTKSKKIRRKKSMQTTQPSTEAPVASGGNGAMPKQETWRPILEVAEDLQIHPDTLYKAARQGRLLSKKNKDNIIIVEEGQALEFIASRTVKRMWTKQQSSLARKMYKEGYGIGVIAYALRDLRPNTSAQDVSAHAAAKRFKRKKGTKRVPADRVPSGLPDPRKPADEFLPKRMPKATPSNSTPPVQEDKGTPVPVKIGNASFNLPKKKAEELLLQLAREVAGF